MAPLSTAGSHGLIAHLRQLVARFETGELLDLLSARAHTPYLARHRVVSLVTRVRLVALAFSGLTLLWIALDAATLPAGQWQMIAIVRVLSVGLFLWLALASERDRTLGQALARLAALMAAPLLLYGITQFLLRDSDLSGLAAINAKLYAALPFIVLAGLSIFPLVMIEGVLLALPVLGAVVLVQALASGFDGIELLSTLWILVLSLGVYLLACATQLHYMMALLHRASYDPLTRALTRRSGAEVLDLQFRLAAENNHPLAIAFLDLDKFKAINDEHGHEAGDAALRDAAATLQHLLRKADVIVRWGGEEFVIVLLNTDMAGVRILIQRVLDEWLGLRPDGTPLTASIGVAERQADAVGDWVELVKLADERMYVAKQSGRARGVLGADVVMLPSTSG